MRKTIEVLRLRAAGMSAREIARAVGAARSTIGEYLRRADEAGITWPLPDDVDDEALFARLFPKAEPTSSRPVPDWDSVHKEVKSRRHHVTLRLVWLEWRELHPDGWGYSQFCEHYRRWLATKDVVMRLSYAAGERMFVDFCGDKAGWCDPETGEVHQAEVFVAVLGCSGMLYAEATRGQDLFSWVGTHVHAFEAFGGVT
jgi:transposase